MDGTGQEQTGGDTTDQNQEDENGPESPRRKEGREQDRHGGGALATDRSDKAVGIQSIVSSDDYAGSSESGA